MGPSIGAAEVFLTHNRLRRLASAKLAGRPANCRKSDEKRNSRTSQYESLRVLSLAFAARNTRAFGLPTGRNDDQQPAGHRGRLPMRRADDSTRQQSLERI